MILLAGGIAALQSAHENVALLRPLAGVALLISAIVVLLGPWWLRIARDLVVERQARVRAEERADIASWPLNSQVAISLRSPAQWWNAAKTVEGGQAVVHQPDGEQRRRAGPGREVEAVEVRQRGERRLDAVAGAPLSGWRRRSRGTG